METVGNFIHGKTTLSSSGETLPVTNPATGKVIRQVTQSTREEMLAAIQSAHEAFPAWRNDSATPGTYPLIQSITEKASGRTGGADRREHGKVWSDALGELTRGIEVVEFACGIPHQQRRVLL